MAYERVNWENLPSTNTPVNADNLNKMENGIDQAGAEIFVGAEEPVAGEKVWFNKDKNSIYVRNSNGVYEEFIKKEDIAKVNIVSAKTGYTLISQDIFKQGKHYWGYVVIKKDSGVFDANDYNVADINIKSSSNAINNACYLSDDVWASKGVGYLYVSQYNSKTGVYPFVIVKDTNNSNLNYAKFFIDMIED